MIHSIFGDIGTGKTIFLTRIIADAYFNHGREILGNSRRIIDEQNKKRTKKLSYPDRVPIYCNFKVKITNPDGSKYEPYKIKGKDIGIGKKYKKLYPGALIIIDEAQDEFNSKGDLPRAVSAFFEKSRHASFEIWLASQRPILINKDIRDITQHFIEIQKLEKEIAAFNIVCGLLWHCREFTSRADVDEYVEQTKAQKSAKKSAIKYKETTYSYNGKLLNYYDTHSCIDEYLPPEGEDYAN